jgi:hypothetical protein
LNNTLKEFLESDGYLRRLPHMGYRGLFDSRDYHIVGRIDAST